MKIAVHYEKNLQEDSYSHKWINFLEKNKVDVCLINFKQSNIIEKIKDCDGIMWHWFHSAEDKQCAPKILQAIEEALNIPIFPNIKTRWHFDEKVAQHYFLDAINAPKIKSWVFWNYNEAKIFLEKSKYPLVYKLSVGAGSSHVIKLDTKKQAIKLLKKNFIKGVFPYTEKTILFKQKYWRFKISHRLLDSIMFILLNDYPKLPKYFIPQKNYIYLQEFIPDNNYDIRITTIGNRAFCFTRYNRKNDFRASGSGMINYDQKKIPLEAIKIAHKISKENGFQSMAYDFLINKKNQILINEISYCYVNKAIHKCPGYWDRNLKWYSGNIWPEKAQVDDFIKSISNK